MVVLDFPRNGKGRWLFLQFKVSAVWGEVAWFIEHFIDEGIAQAPPLGLPYIETDGTHGAYQTIVHIFGVLLHHMLVRTHFDFDYLCHRWWFLGDSLLTRGCPSLFLPR